MREYYKNEWGELWHGDCLEVMDLLAITDSADAVVTDPPYFLPATHYNVRSGSFRSLSDLSMLEHFFRDVFTGIRSVLKKDGFCYAFCDGQSYPVFYVSAYRHFKTVRPLIWDKGVSINGYSWRHQHEIIMFCEGHESPSVKTGDGDVLKHRAVPIKERDHLAQKPTDLLARLIQKTTPEKGKVLDPFMGSGATALAAEMVGRRWIGIEKEERYCEIIAKRLDARRN